MEIVESSTNRESSAETKRGGWRAVMFIIGTEILERMGTMGVSASLLVYLKNVFHMEQVQASNVNFLWSALNNFSTLFGALVSDAYLGRFKTIAFASFFSILGLVTMILTAWLPQLHPSPCKTNPPDHCAGPNKLQFGILWLGLILLAIGNGGITPCIIPFGVDQIAQRTEQEQGIKGIATFFNFYYLTHSLVLIFVHTALVYLQSVNWVAGYSVQTGLMGCAMVLFFVGIRFYLFVKPEGSVFSSIAQVIVAACKKRKLKIPTVEYYNPPVRPSVITKLPLTSKFKFLDKAAVITDGDLRSEGVPANKWRLSSIQEVEEVKCLIKVIPVWSAGIISIVAMTTQENFILNQAMQMDQHMGPHIKIPPSSIMVISYITIGIWVPIYDRVLVPYLWRTREVRLTFLQRMGIGLVFSIFSLFAAGYLEQMRRTRASEMTQMSVFWLAFPLVLMGLSESFNFIGQIEFFNSQFPEQMRTVGNSLFPLSFGVATCLDSMLVSTVHKLSRGKDRPDWLNDNLDKGKLDYYYYLIAGLGVVNILYFLYCARSYQYKVGSQIEETSFRDIEPNRRHDQSTS